MPISSGSRQTTTTRLGGLTGGRRRSYWPNAMRHSPPADDRDESSENRYNVQVSSKQRRGPNQPAGLPGKSQPSQRGLAPRGRFKQIKQISSPTSVASSSPAVVQAAARASRRQQQQQVNLNPSSDDMNSLGGHLVVTGATRQTNSAAESEARQQQASSKETTTRKPSASTFLLASGHRSAENLAEANNKAGSSSLLVNNSQYPALKQSAGLASQSSLNPSVAAMTTSSSTAHLHSLASLYGAGSAVKPSASPPADSTLSINRSGLSLKYVKTLIIVLMALDLLITVFVHQLSSNDEMSIWSTSYKLRFSLLNLILSSIWFIVLIGAVLFDVYFILLIGSLVDISSFLLLLVLSVIHFTQRIDYNTVQLTHLLCLLFSIIVLHVYLLVMAALTTHLMFAVRRRRRSRP